jgi:hypothetical protein
VRDHLAFGCLAESESLHGLREDHGRLALVIHRRRVRREDLARVVAAAVETPDVVIGHVGDHFLELGKLAEEVLARVRATLGLEVLVFAVDAFFHDAPEEALSISRQQRIPT